MFKIKNCKVQNKRTGEKFGTEKIIVRYLIRIVQRGNLAEKKSFMYDYSVLESIFKNFQ